MRDLMKSETWMTAKQAVEMGFADEIFDTKAKNMASILDRFKPDAALTEKVIGLESAIIDAENQISELSANLATSESDLQNAVTELAEAKASNETITAQLTEAQTQLQAEKDAVIAKGAEIETLNAKLIEVEASANARAIEIAAQAGLAPLNVSMDEPAPTNHLEHIKNLSPAEKTAYVKKHKKEIQLQLTK
jgi:chromosome segregation ATPase